MYGKADKFIYTYLLRHLKTMTEISIDAFLFPDHNDEMNSCTVLE